jgi:hypothetical protein
MAYVCHICGERFKKYDEVGDHMKANHELDWIKCHDSTTQVDRPSSFCSTYRYSSICDRTKLKEYGRVDSQCYLSVLSFCVYLIGITQCYFYLICVHHVLAKNVVKFINVHISTLHVSRCQILSIQGGSDWVRLSVVQKINQIGKKSKKYWFKNWMNNIKYWFFRHQKNRSSWWSNLPNTTGILKIYKIGRRSTCGAPSNWTIILWTKTLDMLE